MPVYVTKPTRPDPLQGQGRVRVTAEVTDEVATLRVPENCTKELYFAMIGSGCAQVWPPAVSVAREELGRCGGGGGGVLRVWSCGCGGVGVALCSLGVCVEGVSCVYCAGSLQGVFLLLFLSILLSLLFFLVRETDQGLNRKQTLALK